MLAGCVFKEGDGGAAGMVSALRLYILDHSGQLLEAEGIPLLDAETVATTE